jgi:hypothetical protein
LCLDYSCFLRFLPAPVIFSLSPFLLFSLCAKSSLGGFLTPTLLRLDLLAPHLLEANLKTSSPFCFGLQPMLILFVRASPPLIRPAGADLRELVLIRWVSTASSRRFSSSTSRLFFPQLRPESALLGILMPARFSLYLLVLDLLKFGLKTPSKFGLACSRGLSCRSALSLPFSSCARR